MKMGDEAKSALRLPFLLACNPLLSYSYCEVRTHGFQRILMLTINTVRGPVETSALGTTLMHEHVFVLSTEIMQNFPEAWGDEEQRIADAVRRMNELKSG